MFNTPLRVKYKWWKWLVVAGKSNRKNLAAVIFAKEKERDECFRVMRECFGEREEKKRFNI